MPAEILPHAPDFGLPETIACSKNITRPKSAVPEKFHGLPQRKPSAASFCDVPVLLVEMIAKRQEGCPQLRLVQAAPRCKAFGRPKQALRHCYDRLRSSDNLAVENPGLRRTNVGNELAKLHRVKSAATAEVQVLEWLLQLPQTDRIAQPTKSSFTGDEVELRQELSSNLLHEGGLNLFEISLQKAIHLANMVDEQVDIFIEKLTIPWRYTLGARPTPSL
mmetsp:Transcript_32049/g.70064  ORF Transcript_32049/g.70064 Transcript_32049/m.70064 type:complete len:220 (+) Transcript_32049:736-1395(+)